MNRFVAAIVLVSLSTAAQGATLRGTVFDSHGDPISNARVGIATAAPREGEPLFCPSCYLDCAKSAQTDSKGRYNITGLSDALKFRVLITAKNQKAQLTRAVDPRAGDCDIVLASLPTDFPAAHTVRGRVIDDKKRVVPGALVDPAGAKTAKSRWYGQVDRVEPGVSDADGRFVMHLPDDYQAIDVEVTAEGKAGTVPHLLEPGEKEHEIELPSGTRVTGRLVDQQKPVAGLRIAVAQLDRSGNGYFAKAVPSTTDESGRFDFKFLPANQRYAIYTLVGYGATENRNLVLTTKLFTAKANNASRDLGDLKVEPALHIQGAVELPEGQLLPADAKLVVSRDPAWDLISVPIGADGRFKVEGIPAETYELRVAAKGFEIDTTKLPYQSLGPQSFGIRVHKSVDDLRVPVVKK